MDARTTMDSFDTNFRPHFELPSGLAPVKERLPFTLRVVTSDEHLAKAVGIRHRAYGRHVPALADQLKLPEPLDRASGCAVLLAESNLDGEPLGTMRIQTNRYRPLAIESSVTLPRSLAGCSLAEAARLGITTGRVGHLVRTALFKAFYLYCVQTGIDWMVIGGRPPLDRLYLGLLFSDLFPSQPPIPLKHAGNIPHRVLSFEVGTAEERWSAAQHPLYDFVFRTHHPDIDLGAAQSAESFRVIEEEQTALAA